MTPEGQVEKCFADEVKKAGGMTAKLAPTVVGIPDRIVVLPGRGTSFVELKAVNGKLSPAQVVWIDRARRLGADVVVLYGVEEVREWVRGTNGGVT